MFCDIVIMDGNEEIKKFGEYLGFDKIFFREDIEKLNLKEANEYTEARKLVEGGKVKILLNPHLFGRKNSYSFDRPGLDHIICKAANKNNIYIAFSLNKINSSKEMKWIMDSIKLCRKYKVKILFFSFAEHNYGMVGRTDFLSLLRILGMTGGEAKTALSFIN